MRSATMAAGAILLLTGASSAAAQAQLPAHPVDPEIADGTAQQQLDAARQRWQAAQIDDYHFSVERLCFCVPVFRGPATIVVRDGAPADEEIAYRITGFTVDRPRYLARGDIRLQLHWEGPRGNATRTLACRDGVLISDWPDPAVCTRVLATPMLAEPITIETRDLRVIPDPTLFTVSGHIEGRSVQFVWPGRGSSTRLGRLRAWETALGPDAIAAVRGA